MASRTQVMLAAAVAALGLAGGEAQAAPTFHWCPGQLWDQSWGSIYDWDWNHCHDWQRAAGQGGPMGSGPWGVHRLGRRRSPRRHRGPRVRR